MLKARYSNNPEQAIAQFGVPALMVGTGVPKVRNYFKLLFQDFEYFDLMVVSYNSAGVKSCGQVVYMNGDEIVLLRLLAEHQPAIDGIQLHALDVELPVRDGDKVCARVGEHADGGDRVLCHPVMCVQLVSGEEVGDAIAERVVGVVVAGAALADDLH